MWQTLRVWLMLGVFLFTHCSRSGEKEVVQKDAYGEYDIAEEEKGQREGEVHTVEIKQMKFQPEVLNVHMGDKVVWVNKDIVEHDVTELKGKTWTSSKMAAGASWSMIVTKSELYYCNLHVVMRGKIVADGKDISMVSEPSFSGSSPIAICGQ